MEFELNSKEPIYIQIKKHIEMKIVSGEFKGGERMSSVREFANSLKVNPNTIQRVYMELENDNLIYTQRGVGKFITDDKSAIKQLRKNISKEKLEEFIKTTKLLGFTKEEVVESILEMYEEV